MSITLASRDGVAESDDVSRSAIQALNGGLGSGRRCQASSMSGLCSIRNSLITRSTTRPLLMMSSWVARKVGDNMPGITMPAMGSGDLTSIITLADAV